MLACSVALCVCFNVFPNFTRILTHSVAGKNALITFEILRFLGRLIITAETFFWGFDSLIVTHERRKQEVSRFWHVIPFTLGFYLFILSRSNFAY